MDVEAIDAKMEAMCTEMEVSEEIYRYGLSENPHIIMVRPPTRCSWHLASAPSRSFNFCNGMSAKAASHHWLYFVASSRSPVLFSVEGTWMGRDLAKY